MITDSEKRAILIRAKARAFATQVKNTYGMAMHIPEDIVDWLKDDEIPVFFEHLRKFGLVQRKDDRMWEKLGW